MFRFILVGSVICKAVVRHCACAPAVHSHKAAEPTVESECRYPNVAVISRSVLFLSTNNFTFPCSFRANVPSRSPERFPRSGRASPNVARTTPQFDICEYAGTITYLMCRHRSNPEPG
ncbi:hypothetical protein C8Q72DRAFT_545437 [Fomitopsis betulina]|nr:hypothetical protein C8Q72DRAFT_545437 [Fomitopsis betulina]